MHFRPYCYITPELVAHLQASADFQALLVLKDSAKGPIPTLLATQALAQTYDSLSNWPEAIQHWRDCLHLSPATPSLWEHLGDSAWKAGRFALAISSFQSSYRLCPSLPVLLKVAKSRLSIHDYANALALVSYIVDLKPGLEGAEETRQVILKVLQGQELYSGGVIREREELRLEPERVELKAANLLTLAKSLRKLLEAGKSDCIFTVSKGSLKDQYEQKPSTSKPVPKRLSAFHSLTEDIKSALLSHSSPLCMPAFGLHPMPVVPSFKPYSPPEPLFFAYLDQDWRPKALTLRLIRDLCGNKPRPSPALSDDLAWEIVQLYLIGEVERDLGDEVLTVFELSLRERELITVLEKLHSAACAKLPLYTNPELLLRYKHAEAWFYYHLGEEKADSAQQKAALALAFQLAEETQSLLQSTVLYLWWWGKVLSTASLSALKENIKDELLLLKLELALSTKAGSLPLTIFAALAALLSKRVETDNPVYYSKKAKPLLKALLKASLSAADRALFAASLRTFLGVVLYHLEEGFRVGKEVDLGLMVQAARRVYMEGNKAEIGSVEAGLMLNVVNLIKAKPELVTELPVVIKRAIPSRQTKAQYFSQLHRLTCQYAKDPSAYHFSLCQAFEKDVFLAGSQHLQRLIYSQLYGLQTGAKECCGLGKVVAGEGVPKSVGKLRRVLDYIAGLETGDEAIGLYRPQTYSKEISPVVARFSSGFPSPCPQLSVRPVLSHSPLPHPPTCCDREARTQYERLLVRYVSDSFEQALDKEHKPAFLQLLETAETHAERLVVLNSTSGRAWMLLGQVYVHKWMSGYFDSAVMGVFSEKHRQFAGLAIRCFQTLETLDPSYAWYTLLIRGLVGFLEYRLSGDGLFEAERLLYAAALSPNATVEAILIAALCELHMKSERAEDLLQVANELAQGKYASLALAAKWKLGKIPASEADLWDKKDRYLTYLTSKITPSSDQLALLTAPKMLDSKVLDRCLVLPKKQIRLVQRFSTYYRSTRQASKLLHLLQELEGKTQPTWEEVWALTTQEAAESLRELQTVEEMRSVYDLGTYVEGREWGGKKAVQAILEEAVKVGQQRFGPEKCEEMRPVKRRRRK